jgi:hypothetical protein
MPDSERITLEPMRLERIEIAYRRDGSVWIRHENGDTFGPFESIVDAVEAGVA